MNLLEQLTETGIVSIVREANPSSLVEIVGALREGGIRAVEVTLNSPSALRVIDTLSVKFGDDMLIGAGTVLDPESARAALLAGARYIVSPTLDLRTIEMTKRYGAISIPGAFTPSEILAAFQAGADIINVFPATVLGPGYIRDIHKPLPQIPLMPTGGIDETNIASYIKAGAVAVGLGSHLVNGKLEVTDAYLTDLTQKARQFIQRVQKARGV